MCDHRDESEDESEPAQDESSDLSETLLQTDSDEISYETTDCAENRRRDEVYNFVHSIIERSRAIAERFGVTIDATGARLSYREVPGFVGVDSFKDGGRSIYGDLSDLATGARAIPTIDSNRVIVDLVSNTARSYPNLLSSDQSMGLVAGVAKQFPVAFVFGAYALSGVIGLIERTADALLSLNQSLPEYGFESLSREDMTGLLVDTIKDVLVPETRDDINGTVEWKDIVKDPLSDVAKDFMHNSALPQMADWYRENLLPLRGK
jgi:hypothetical protein